jgi:iron-sulfur cluster assembly accessory protein
MIEVTDSAVKYLQILLRNEADDSHTGLRIFVEKGGCAGMQYGMKLDSPIEGDEITERDGMQIYIDRQSMTFLKGSTIDYTDSLTGTGFRIVNPNAQRSCGCGTSFEAAPAQNAGYR